MKKYSSIILFFLFGIAFVSCGDGFTKKVVNTYESGQPSKVYIYDGDGQWVREVDYHENGLVYMEGAIKDGLRDGEWISYFPDGKVQSTGFFEEDVRVGPSKVYYENGHLWMDGQYKDDHKCGEWIFYDEQGYETQRVVFGSCD